MTSKRPCKLGSGEARRVPQDTSYHGLVGYHLCCPRCGFVTAVLQGHDGMIIKEQAGSISMSKPIRCVYCNVLIAVDDGELTLTEDKHVRNVCFRRTDS